MIAIDTNVLARILLRDDTSQADVAENLLATEIVEVGHGVLMELEWVLRSRGWGRTAINRGLVNILALPNVRTDQPELVSWALARHAAGGDLADMLHLVASRANTAFATFDRALTDLAGPAAPVPVTTLL